MKLSFDWLGDFVDLDGLSAQDVAERLTMHAFEVEELTCSGPDIRGPLLVGQILEINPHPNADKIRVTSIRLSEDGPATEIVCGAWNIEVGQKVPVALPGACVINRHDGSPLPIKESKIRGVTSNGMLCSAGELGIAGGGDGIHILSPDSLIGEDAKELLGLKADYILHVEPRSNRGDALSVLGLAREVAALFGRPLKKLGWIEEFAAMKEQSESAPQLEIENESDCPYFSIRRLSGVKIEPASALIKNRLESIGVKPVNNVVDITNYVLHELGQPLHAYDIARLKGDKLRARRAKTGESIVTIDQKDRKLSDEVLVIADDAGPVAVAGVMGGKHSEISEESSELAIEAASFSSARVRRSSRLLGLSSDSSLRFERGVDRAQVQQASDRAAYLLVKYCGARLGKYSSAGSSQVPAAKITLRMSELERICEIEMKADTASKLLEPLGFKSQVAPEDLSAGRLEVQIPSFRQKDVYREIDLIEEICRLHGYENLPVSMPASTIAALPPDPLPASIRQSMTAAGLSEAWISSLVGQEDLDARKCFSINGDDSTIAVLNPLSPEHQFLRKSLLPGLIKAASYNQDRGNSCPCLFELGKVYRKDSRRFNNQLPAQKQTQSHEELMVSAIICGDPQISQWTRVEKMEEQGQSYFFMKGILENMAGSLGIPKRAVQFLRSDEVTGWFHPGRSAMVVVKSSELSGEEGNTSPRKKAAKDIKLGFIGEIHPAVADAYRLSGRAAIMEISLSSLASCRCMANFEEIPSTPAMQRDLTADLQYAVENRTVEDCIFESCEQTLRRLDLISVYKLSENRKSLSYRLTFQDRLQTLTAESVDATMAKIRAALAARLNAEFRL